MKKFLTTNILLSAGAVFGLSAAIDTAFEVDSVSVNLQEIKTSFQKNTLLNKVSSSFTKKISLVDPEIFAEFENLEFTPESESIHEESVREDIKFSYINKSKELNEKLSGSVSLPSAPSTNIELELSYKEVKSKGRYKIDQSMVYVWNDSFKGIEKNNEDRISTKLAATEKSSSSKKNITNKKPNVISSKASVDELVFFEYSHSQNEKKVIKSNSGPESTTRNNALAQLTGEVSSVDSATLGSDSSRLQASNLLAAKEMEAALAKDSSMRKQDAKKSSMPTSQDLSCLNSEASSAEVGKSIVSFKVDSILKEGAGFENLHNFEMRFQDDVDDIHQDYGSGEIKLEYSLSSQMNIRRVNIFANSHYPLAMDLVFEQSKVDVSIPMLTRNYLSDILNERNIKDLGAHFLVELDESTEAVDIDQNSEFEAKLFLDKSFRVVSQEESDYSYILFIGVTPGNRVISYTDSKQRVTDKIIYLAENEVYYDPNFYAEINTDRVRLYEEGPLSKCKSFLDINKKEIELWSYAGKTKKESLNTFSISRMLYPLGTRKYYELKHLDESIFVGRWSSRNIIVPTESYISHVIREFDTQSSDQCLVQINLSKPVKEFSFNGVSATNGMRAKMKVLDRDGQFYNDFSQKSERIFIAGQEQGILNFRLKYTDGSEQFLQSYCSSSTYLVEQL